MSIQEMIYAQVELFNRDQEGIADIQCESWPYILRDIENN
jgi:hypothetical protein